MQQTDYTVVFITAKDEEEAREIAQTLLQRRQAACVNIVAEVESHFWWQNKLDSSRESLVIIKTKGSLLSDIINTVKKIHSYTIPEIIALPISGGSQEYLDWIDREVT
jgi:periplasmic divalent cation tolerance protein